MAMSANIDVVQDFIAAWNAQDFERMLGFFDVTSFYHNIPMDPVTGKDAIRGILEGFFNMGQEIDWVVHSIAEAADGTVLTERTDRFLMNGNWFELRVMGAFELDGTTIRAWRDYFCMKRFETDLAAVNA